MKSTIAIFLIVAALAAQANPEPQPDLQFISGTLVENAGLKSILSRRKTMTRIERPVAQRMDNGSIISVYADDSITTQAVSMVRMSPTTIAKANDLASDRDTLKAAKALVKQIKANHGESVADLTEAEIVSASESVFDTSTKDKAASATVGILLGVAAAAATGKKGTGKTKGIKS